MRYYSDSVAYDAANQLVREDNGFINKTVTYTYDSWGNILTKSEYPYTTGTLGTPSNSVNYTYANSAWGDQLTSYNGETISYDAMGNPVSYRGYTTSFEGKQLVSAVKTGKNITFAYDENGLRTQKTVNNVTTNYYYNGSVLMNLTQGDTSLLFSYDAAGNVVAVEVQSDSWSIDGQTLYYIRNGQGDITGLIDSSGRTVIEYRYDTWGKDCSYQPEYQEYLDLQELNPFRYRGYVYDTETGWYYLQSRYYDPEVGRFLSADVLLSTGQGVLGHNTYAYCLNNPVNMWDDEGTSPAVIYVEDCNTKSNDDGGYTTTITYVMVIVYPNSCYVHSYSYTVSIDFTIDDNGIAHVDNAQPNIHMILNSAIGSAFAKEIMKTAKAVNEEYFAGRTKNGILFELMFHYIAHVVKPTQQNAESTDIGGTSDSVGYDRNAAAFEKPIENWHIWYEMIKQWLG